MCGVDAAAACKVITLGSFMIDSLPTSELAEYPVRRGAVVVIDGVLPPDILVVHPI